MTLIEAIKKAVDERNLRMVNKLLDTLRFKHGFNYQDTFDLFHKHTGLDAAQFENLCYEADRDS